MREICNKFKDELLNSCVPFWLNHGVDTEFGGVLNCLDRKGKVYSEDKSVWMQGRAGWMFSYIYNNIENEYNISHILSERIFYGFCDFAFLLRSIVIQVIVHHYLPPYVLHLRRRLCSTAHARL